MFHDFKPYLNFTSQIKTELQRFYFQGRHTDIQVQYESILRYSYFIQIVTYYTYLKIYRSY